MENIIQQTLESTHVSNNNEFVTKHKILLKSDEFKYGFPSNYAELLQQNYSN